MNGLIGEGRPSESLIPLSLFSRNEATKQRGVLAFPVRLNKSSADLFMIEEGSEGDCKSGPSIE